MGKIIVVEGTDCSGKETQTKRLVQNLLDMGIKAIRMAFPMYDTPTGKIIGGAFLGKEQFDIKPVFEETSVNVPASYVDAFYIYSQYVFGGRRGPRSLMGLFNEGLCRTAQLFQEYEAQVDAN